MGPAPAPAVGRAVGPARVGRASRRRQVLPWLAAAAAVLVAVVGLKMATRSGTEVAAPLLRAEVDVASGPALASGTVAGQAPAALSDDAFDSEVKSLGAEIGALESRSAEF